MENGIVKEGVSKKGVPYVIRYPKPGDLHGLHEYINTLSKERTYIRLQGEEIPFDEEQKYLETKLKEIEAKKSVKLLLIVDGTICGACNVDLKDKTENHVGIFGISVASAARGQGLGEILLQSTIDEAIKNLEGLKIITLCVFEPNTAAKKLYEKAGFIRYGYLPGGGRHRDEIVDEIYLYKKV